jgi:SAM-dependent methyltransferase
MPVLPFGLTADAIAAAMAESDPDSLAAATRLRHVFGPDLATAALHQAALRRRARAKFGAYADAMFFTRTGLEQATRPEVADHHAARLVGAGARRVIDLGCGIGSDALAFVRAGLEVVAVDIDPDTASVARSNVGPSATVICADAEAVAADLVRPGDAVFADPARRDDHGRVWRVEDFTPRWSLITGLLDGSRIGGVKLGPALPPAFVPAAAEAEWLTHRGDTVEVGLWAGPGAEPGRRSALVLPDARLIVRPTEPLDVGPLGAYLYEPDGAVIRAGGVAQLGADLEAHLLDQHLAYLTGDQFVLTPFATAFRVLDRLPYAIKDLRTWVKAHDVGRLEIKKRGIDVDPAELRKRLRPSGSASATLVISRTPRGALVAVVERLR